jgi:hypothetical protein
LRAPAKTTYFAVNILSLLSILSRLKTKNLLKDENEKCGLCVAENHLHFSTNGYDFTGG